MWHRNPHVAAVRSLHSRLPEKIASAVHEFAVSPLADNPHRVGKRLLNPPFENTWSARRGSYRVLYEIDEDARTATVVAVEHRFDAYRSR
ncbi:type II toxin-antitoxin system RelE family toxin [Streptomonospora mangrovi]|uniref:type II toxin-antitoxin system RelE family toxin n=1 Tax=Streptomonospora mangrovi TaxID=2883123 RepID=UPI0022DD34A3|nr:type II toxin-antitoxin system RelE/ParE family toxin [Streptomonospora mangrovi]